MCGRFTLAERLENLQSRYNILDVSIEYEPSYNIAPTDNIVTVMNYKGEKRFNLYTWGIPISEGRIINARDDKVESSNFYKLGLTYNRCLVPSTGFFEWVTSGSKKIPYYIKSTEDSIFSFAGFYHKQKQDGQKYCTFFTTEPNEHMSKIHDRMPVILQHKEEEMWLNPDTTMDEALELLKPYPNEFMESYIVSNKVNNPKNNFPQLIKPVVSLKKFF